MYARRAIRPTGGSIISRYHCNLIFGKGRQESCSTSPKGHHADIGEYCLQARCHPIISGLDKKVLREFSAWWLRVISAKRAAPARKSHQPGIRLKYGWCQIAWKYAQCAGTPQYGGAF